MFEGDFLISLLYDVIIKFIKILHIDILLSQLICFIDLNYLYYFDDFDDPNNDTMLVLLLFFTIILFIFYFLSIYLLAFFL